MTSASEPPTPTTGRTLSAGAKTRWPALLLAAIAGLLAFLLLRDVAFPTASLNFAMDRGMAQGEGRAFWAARAIELKDYWSTVTFTLDYSAKDYIDQKAGLATLDRLAQREISVWRWEVRFFKPLQKEEFSVTFDVNGRLVGFDHVIAEDRPGAKLPTEQAQASASAYLRERQKLNMDDYTLVESSQETRPQRIDHTFTWERRGFKVADATYRLTVVVRGDEIGSYYEGLKIPESWFNEQQRIWEHSNLLGSIGSALNFFLFAALLVAFLLEMRGRRIRWRFALLVAAAVAVIIFATSVNSLPLLMAGYDTKESLSAYFLDLVVFAFLTIAGAVIYISGQGATGESLSRRLWPERPSLSQLLSGAGIRSRPYVAAIAAGYALGLFQVGYVLAFYKIGQERFGVWVPVGVNYSDILSTWFPWLYPMTVGAWAAVNEETFYRLFSISLLRRRLPSWLAALIPGVIWASLHAWYPMQPFFIRVLELSIAGFILGLAFLRYGVLATIVAHYLYNAAVSGPVIWDAGNWPAKVGLLFVLVLPALTLLPAAWGRLRGRPLLRPGDLPPEPQPPPLPAAVPQPAPSYAPARRLPWRTLATVVVLAGLGLAAILALPPPQLGSFLDVGISRRQAEDAARDKLRELGFSPEGYQAVTDFTALVGGHDSAYLAQELSVAGADRFLRDHLPTYSWRVRFWRPEQEESFKVLVDPQHGQPVRLEHTLEEKEPGAKLEVTAAQRLAEEALSRELNAPPGKVRLVQTESEERPARTDHTFTWEREDLRVGDGALRHYVTIKGDSVGAYGSYLKVPESYIRQREEKTAWYSLKTAGLVLLVLAVILARAVTFIRRFRDWRPRLRLFFRDWQIKLPLLFRDWRINYRFALALAGFMALVGLVGWLNGLPLFFFGYRHTESLTSYIIRRIVAEPQAIAWNFARWAVMAALALTLYRQAFPGEMPLEQQLVHWRERLSGRGWQVSLLALAVYPLYHGLLTLGGWVWVLWLPAEASEVAAPYGLLDPALPALAALTDSIEEALTLGLSLALLASFLTLYARRQRRILALAFVGASLCGVLTGRTPLEGLLNGGAALLLAAVGSWLVIKVLRHDAVACLAVLFTLFMMEHGLRLVHFSTPWYAANGWAILGLGLLPVVLLLLADPGKGQDFRSLRDFGSL
jgi:membrane protease YdiL (CAAX protease family)